MKIPAALGKRGALLWTSIMDGPDGPLEGDQHDEEMVLETCRILDVIDALSAAIDRDGVTTKGSTGQIVIHPAVAELRLQQQSFARLLAQLNLEEVQVGVMLTPRQTASRAAAQKRWRDLKSARAGGGSA